MEATQKQVAVQDEKTLDESTYDDIRKIIQNKDLINTKLFKELNHKKLDLGKSHLAVADMFLDCYELLDGCATKLKDKKSDHIKAVTDFLAQFKDVAGDLRLLFNEFHRGDCIGDYPIRVRIERNVNVNREKYVKLIKTFFKIFGEDI